MWSQNARKFQFFINQKKKETKWTFFETKKNISERAAACVFFRSTWNTVKHDWVNVSKWLRASTASVNLPPKICIPNREKMKMNRKRITSKEFIDEMEFTRDFTKLPIDAQYLKIQSRSQHNNLIIRFPNTHSVIK